MKTKVIFNCRDIVLIEGQTGFVVCSEFNGADESGTVQGRNRLCFENPLEAFNYWILLVDAVGRRSIGNYLIRQGRNPHTGELDPDIIKEACESIKKDR